MIQPVLGIHHITAFASDPQQNVDFYHNILGQRLIKKTVNFDDPGTYHLYYGDETGSPGTILTFFPWLNARRGRLGNGETGALAYSIRPESASFWNEHLEKNGVDVTVADTRFGHTVLSFEDPDGMTIELITVDHFPALNYWQEGPVPEEHALGGFHSVTLWVSQAEPTAAVLTEQMGYQLVGQEGNRRRFQGESNDLGLYVDLLIRPGERRGIQGAGSVHHVAFRTRSDDEQLEYQAKLSQAGLGVTEVKDRQYFHSIYFREPNGVLFEIATDAPGFLYDEAVDQLGSDLKLPPWLEPYRQQIESALPPISVKPAHKMASDE